MVKMNFTNNQTAFAYAIYMMVGSYFKKAACTSSILENNMRLQYVEQRLDNQYRMEDMCIRYAEHQLLSSTPANLWEEEVKVKVVKRSEDEMELRFMGSHYILVVTGTYRGKQSRIFHKLWRVR